MNTKKVLKTLKEMKNWRNLSWYLGYEDSKEKSKYRKSIKTAIEYYNSPNEISDKKLKKAIHNLKYFKCIIKDNLNYTKYNLDCGNGINPSDLEDDIIYAKEYIKALKYVIKSLKAELYYREKNNE